MGPGFWEDWCRCRERSRRGCGLAWMAERSWREEMEKLAALNGVTYEAVYEN